MLKNSKVKSKTKMTLKIIHNRPYTAEIRINMQRTNIISSQNQDGKGMREREKVTTRKRTKTQLKNFMCCTGEKQNKSRSNN